jgi:transcriptional regulator with XRE-family HTH domain
MESAKLLPKVANRKYLGFYLRQKRELVNLTQAQVAEAVGYTTAQYVSNWERGASSPPAQGLRKLVKILHIDRREILDILVAIDRTKWEQTLSR